MKVIVLLVLLSHALLFGGTITIAVAANVSYAIEELKEKFSTLYRDTTVRITLGGSGKLSAQIHHGAPYDIFMSANMLYPQTLYDNKHAITEPIVYAQGALALFSTKKQDFSQGIKLLTCKKISKIAIANPKTAPYGKAAFEALKNAKIFNTIKSKFVYSESISQTVSYAMLATDIGIIAKSSLYSSKMSQYKEQIHWSALDPKLYTPINQGIVILKHSKNTQEVRAFYDFILSDDAKVIFKKYGYII
ncbi:MAG: molybdate ABC transporter substrate-binding protein [Campylobacterota bacterium]|nr:molybdate ABC transporter substrate-binding protein [Campylobacterota bacterium]